jgi:hypothetical protein
MPPAVLLASHLAVAVEVAQVLVVTAPLLVVAEVPILL